MCTGLRRCMNDVLVCVPLALGGSSAHSDMHVGCISVTCSKIAHISCDACRLFGALSALAWPPGCRLAQCAATGPGTRGLVVGAGNVYVCDLDRVI